MSHFPIPSESVMAVVSYWYSVNGPQKLDSDEFTRKNLSLLKKIASYEESQWKCALYYTDDLCISLLVLNLHVGRPYDLKGRHFYTQSREILNLWQSYWGNLEPKWVPNFLSHKSMSFLKEIDIDILKKFISENRKLTAVSEEILRIENCYPLGVFPEIAEDPDFQF